MNHIRLQRTVDGRPICHKCGIPGHFAKYCSKDKNCREDLRIWQTPHGMISLGESSRGKILVQRTRKTREGVYFDYREIYLYIFYCT